MLKLDLGAGEISPPGFKPVGREHGTEIFPLAYGDETVDVIRASHCLEHFGHEQVPAVLADWVRALKKGGKIRIAVPDFAVLAKNFGEGKPDRYEHYLMGAQIDKDDFHKSLFTREKLRGLLSGLNLVLLRPWVSEIEDCAGYDFSLNIEGSKPHVDELKISGAMSVPRLGFMTNMFCAMEAVIPCKVKFRKHGGAFWGQSLTNVFEKILDEDPDADAILTTDYDSVFLPRHLAHLMQLMMLYPEADAIAPVQASRHLDSALFTVDGDNGNAPYVSRERFEPDLLEVNSAHFGLTLIRTEKLRKLSKPWFHSIPSKNNDWHDGHIDEDIAFWHKWRKEGNSLYLANHVAIGHIEETIRWPDVNLKAFYQKTTEFQIKGVPEDVWK